MNAPEPIKVEDIVIPDGRRDADPAAVTRLASSLSEIGLLSPVMVRLVNDYVLDDGEICDGVPVLIAGRHRLEAARSLGWEKIDCVVVEMGDAQAELAEIDENLMRAELSPAERAEQTARRKELYLMLHPETARGVAGGKARQGAAGDKLSFAEDQAAATGCDARTVQRDARRGERIAPEVMREVKADPSLNKGTVLDELARAPRDQQPAKLSEIAQRRAVSRTEVLYSDEAKEKWKNGVRRMWNAAHSEWRQEMLDELSGATL